MAVAENLPQFDREVNGMTQSMTGFASATGAEHGWSWGWEVRSVNGRGLDLRLRVPDWVSGLEAGLRARLQAGLVRGNVTVNLRLNRDTSSGAVDAEAITRALSQIAAVEEIAAREGRSLTPCRAVDVLGMKAGPEALGEDAEAALREALLAHFEHDVMPTFRDSRATEGRALEAILTGRLDEIAALVDRATHAAADRAAHAPDALREALARVLTEVEMDEGRLAQEVALLAVKQDVTEEIDRLRAHVDAARVLLRSDDAKGRKLDFLTQEFNREANTLCAKAQDPALTAVGLDLKSVIDQFREQVQNVE